MANTNAPPGYPGIPPRWTSSAKSGAGTAVGPRSRVWFTLSHGIINEVYYPTIDQANTRDLGFLITDGSGFFAEEKRHTVSEISPLAPGVPGYRITSTCGESRYRITKTIVADPSSDVLLQKIVFEPVKGSLGDYRLYALLAPHIGNRGYGNDGWAGDYKGTPMLFAQRGSTALALACSVPFAAMSCGYAGFSDGWQDISANKRMTWFYPEARDGNIALTGEINLQACSGSFVLALAFGTGAAQAGQQARAALLRDFDQVAADYVRGWQEFQSHCVHDLGSTPEDGFDLYRVSTAVLKTHMSKGFPEGMIASLSIPWGFSKGDDDLGGYHLVWPRDLAECAGGLLAAGDRDGTREALLFLMSAQETDGHWPQNMWLDGTPYWSGVQMDEAAFPVLLADALRREAALNGLDVWPMVRRAAGFLARNGPVTQQDRWEEDGGYSPFTLAVEVAALLAAADFAEEAGDVAPAKYLRQTADAWNASIERWCYVEGIDWSQRVGVDGYYVRIAPPDDADIVSCAEGSVPIKNRPPGQGSAHCAHVVSPDALALVRFGLRSADDPRIVNTVKVIDAALRTDTVTGPVWHRYNHDGYGEHEDGSPFDGTGIGRGWPLLAGERAFYELALGRREEAERLAGVIEAQTSPGGFIPEQVWDAADIPELELLNGRPAGSAMPLAWAHAEYIKLLRSLRDGDCFDTPPQPVARYQVQKVGSPLAIWRFNQKCRTIPPGKVLRIETLAPATIRWSADDWRTVHDTPTQDSGVGTQFADLRTRKLRDGSAIVFTFLWTENQEWQNENFQVQVGGTEAAP